MISTGDEERTSYKIKKFCIDNEVEREEFEQLKTRQANGEILGVKEYDRWIDDRLYIYFSWTEIIDQKEEENKKKQQKKSKKPKEKPEEEK